MGCPRCKRKIYEDDEKHLTMYGDCSVMVCPVCHTQELIEQGQTILTGKHVTGMPKEEYWFE